MKVQIKNGSSEVWVENLYGRHDEAARASGVCVAMFCISDGEKIVITDEEACGMLASGGEKSVVVGDKTYNAEMVLCQHLSPPRKEGEKYKSMMVELKRLSDKG